MKIEQKKLRAIDGYPISATLYSPEDNPTSTLVIINSAMAVPQQFYKNFAHFVAEQNYMTLTYDYRGINDSLTGSIKEIHTKASDWALLDMTAVLDWAKESLRPERVFVIGHSFGGQTPGLLPNSDIIDAMVTLSAQSGYWLDQGGFQKLVVGFHMFFSFPVLSTLLGYMPMSKIGAGEDIPKNVALEWAGWCRKSGYMLADEKLPADRYQNFRAPVLALSFEDDNWGTKKSVDKMMKAYPNLIRRHVDPKKIGRSKIGHFGFFNEKSKVLWTEVMDWLDNCRK